VHVTPDPTHPLKYGNKKEFEKKNHFSFFLTGYHCTRQDKLAVRARLDTLPGLFKRQKKRKERNSMHKLIFQERIFSIGNGNCKLLIVCCMNRVVEGRRSICDFSGTSRRGRPSKSRRGSSSRWSRRKRRCKDLCRSNKFRYLLLRSILRMRLAYSPSRSSLSNHQPKQ